MYVVILKSKYFVPTVVWSILWRTHFSLLAESCNCWCLYLVAARCLRIVMVHSTAVGNHCLVRWRLERDTTARRPQRQWNSKARGVRAGLDGDRWSSHQGCTLTNSSRMVSGKLTHRKPAPGGPKNSESFSYSFQQLQLSLTVWAAHAVLAILIASPKYAPSKGKMCPRNVYTPSKGIMCPRNVM